MSRTELRLLLVLAAVNFTNIVDFMIMMPLQEYLAPVFDINPSQFSYLVAAYAVTAFVSSFSASLYADKFDRKKILLTAFAGLVLGTFLCGVAETYEMLMLARIVAGGFGGLISAQVLSVIGDVIPFDRRGKAMGILMGAFAVASIAGVPLGLFLANTFSWHAPFIAIAIFGMVVMFFVMKFVPSLNAHVVKGNSKFEIYKQAASDRNMQVALFMMLALILSHFLPIPFIAPYLELNVGFTKEDILIMYFTGGVFSILTAPLIGKMSDKYGKIKMFKILLLLASIPVLLLTHLFPVPVPVALIVTSLFFIIAGGRMVPAQAIITSVVPAKLRGGFLNLNASLQQLGVGAASFISGVIVDKDIHEQMIRYNVVGYCSVLVSLLCLYFLLRLKLNQEAG